MLEIVLEEKGTWSGNITFTLYNRSGWKLYRIGWRRIIIGVVSLFANLSAIYTTYVTCRFLGILTLLSGLTTYDIVVQVWKAASCKVSLIIYKKGSLFFLFHLIFLFIYKYMGIYGPRWLKQLGAFGLPAV